MMPVLIRAIRAMLDTGKLQRFFGYGAIALLAIAMAQPAVMSITGLNFEKSHIASSAIDKTPTGSIHENDYADKNRAMLVSGLKSIVKKLGETK